VSSVRSLAADPRRGSRLTAMTLLTPRNAVLLGALGLLLEVLAILPPIDDATATNATLHYTQHGVLFIGGLMMGVALRDLLIAGRR
jgi:hypothetical protein